MRAFPASAAVQLLGSRALLFLSMGNQAGVAAAGSCEALAAALASQASVAAAQQAAFGRELLRDMFAAAKNCVAGTPESKARFASAGGLEAAAQAVRGFAGSDDES